jgi:hypothetical protein
VTFDALLKAAITDAGYSSLRTFSIDAGIARESVRAYTAGDRIPSNAKLEQMGDVLGIREAPTYTQLELALATARLQKKSGANQKYGVQATAALKTADPADDLPTHRIEALVTMFFDHGHRERTPEIEYFIREQITRLLTDV